MYLGDRVLTSIYYITILLILLIENTNKIEKKGQKKSGEGDEWHSRLILNKCSLFEFGFSLIVWCSLHCGSIS